MPYGEGTYGKQVGRPPKEGRAANAAAKRQKKKKSKSKKDKKKRY